MGGGEPLGEPKPATWIPDQVRKDTMRQGTTPDPSLVKEGKNTLDFKRGISNIAVTTD